MGKFRKKIKGQSKGKRWPKGQSSSSNPETKKFRNQSKLSYLQRSSGPSNLTIDAIQKHDAVQSYVTGNDKSNKLPSVASGTSESEDVESSTGSYSTFKTMDTFASEWSDCSNMSYVRFLKVFRSTSLLHKKMLSILAAVTELIKEKGGTESNTEYYCVLLTTLEEVYNTDPRDELQLTAVLALLNMGVKNVPEGVLRKTFSDTALKIVHILKTFVESENNNIIKSSFGILATLLKSQDLAAWSNSSVTNIYTDTIIPFCIHPKPKWRKGAQQAVSSVIFANCFLQEDVPNIAADKVFAFCELTLETSFGGQSTEVVNLKTIQKEETTILHILGLMKETIQKYSKPNIKKACETILRLISLNSPLITSCGLQVLHSLFSSQTVVISATLNSQLIEALYEFQPSPVDVQPTLAWLAVMQQAHVHLADADIDISCSTIPKFFNALSQLWLSVKVEITAATTHTFEVLLEDALGPVCSVRENVERHKSKISKCFNSIASGLEYQYHNIWNQVLHTITVMFEKCGEHCSSLLLGVLKSLAELRDSYKFSFNNELEHAIGAAIRSMGPEVVLSVISLRKGNGELSIDRSWLLPVLKENIKRSTLRYFFESIHPLAIYCKQKSVQLAQNNDGIGSHSSELLYIQLWHLLPCFCNDPSDIKDSFKNIAKLLGQALSEKEVRLAVMASLRKLIASAKQSENKDDIEEISRFAKNYLPILFNVFTTKPIGTEEEGQRLAALETIKLYLSISKPELSLELFKKCIERLNSSSEDPEDPFIKESILDLLRVLIPYQNSEHISIIYEQIIKTLPEIKDKMEQKKVYRLLEEVFCCNSNACVEFIKKNRKALERLLRISLNSTVVSSKGARLRTLNYLIKTHPHPEHCIKLAKSTIAEAVLSCKDINERTRNIAYEVLNTIGQSFIQHNEGKDFLLMIEVGLAGSDQLKSCSILALASALRNFSGSLGVENIQFILENVKTLCASSVREIVASCIAFLKMFLITLPSPMIAASLQTIVNALVNMKEDCRKNFRLQVRQILDKLIRKFSVEAVTSHIPEEDAVLYKMIRNIRKLNARKKRRREENKDEQEGSDDDFSVRAKPKSMEEILADSDSDIEEMETDEPKTSKIKKPNTWIEEDADTILDFTDPKVNSKITVTKPGQSFVKVDNKKPQKKDRGFKTNKDGKLIIKDGGSSSDSDEKEHDDYSDSDENSDSESWTVMGKKRKRSESSIKSGTSGRSSQPPSKYRSGGVGIHRTLSSSKSSVTSSARNVHTGNEYKSKKASGDVKKKGKVDPYAYLPLQRTMLNKRKKMKAAGQFKNIIKATKKGALKGNKAKKKNK